MREHLRRWWARTPMPIDDLRLQVWHQLMTNPTIISYVVDDGVIHYCGGAIAARLTRSVQQVRAGMLSAVPLFEKLGDTARQTGVAARTFADQFTAEQLDEIDRGYNLIGDPLETVDSDDR